MTQNTDFTKYNNLTMAELNKIWNQVQDHIVIPLGDNPYNCIETNYKSTKGRPQVSHKGDHSYYVSIVLCLRKYRLQDPSYNIPHKFECSHLCNNKKCINADWLLFELGDINRSRATCFMFRNIRGYRCPHETLCGGCEGIPGHNILTGYDGPYLMNLDEDTDDD